jgi:hypothetical protein
MASSIIQLHIEPEEFAGFIGGIAKELKLYVVLFRFRPGFSCEKVEDPFVLASVMDLAEGQHVLLLSKEPDLQAENQLEFYDRNPYFISFHFGRRSAEGLRQSSMGYRTDDEQTITIGKEISKKLKEIAKAGVRITNPNTGASSVYKIFRYTDRALALEQSGMQMLPSAGGNLAKLGAE